jgi:hypothetical protein
LHPQFPAAEQGPHPQLQDVGVDWPPPPEEVPPHDVQELSFGAILSLKNYTVLLRKDVFGLFVLRSHNLRMDFERANGLPHRYVAGLNALIAGILVRVKLALHPFRNPLSTFQKHFCHGNSLSNILDNQ